MTVELIFETHALTTDNEAGIATGWLPGALSPRGRELARALGERHRHREVAAVFVSDLARAVQTAELAFGDRGIPIVRDARLRECDYGALTRHPAADIEARRASQIALPFPGGESYEQYETCGWSEKYVTLRYKGGLGSPYVVKAKAMKALFGSVS